MINLSPKKIILLPICFFLFLLFTPKLVKAQITSAIIQQNYFRWYVNIDDVDPNDPWPEGPTNLGENEAITLADSPPAQGTVLRIRMSLYVDPNSTEPIYRGDQFKLQWGEKTSNSCSAINNWYDVTPIGTCSTNDEWCGYDNYTPNDGDPINNLLLSVSDVLETYEEENPATAINRVNPRENGEWDWVIKNNKAKKNASYCFRMVWQDGTPFNSYNYYPELTTEAITVSGTVYYMSTALPYKTVVIKVNGLDKCNGNQPCTDETDENGFYQITNLDIDAADDVLTVFLDNEKEKAVTVTKAANPNSDIFNLDLYSNTVIVRHEGASAVTNDDLGQYDKDDDLDIHFTSNNGSLIVDNDHELHIWTGKTFSPGGIVTLIAGGSSPGGDLHIDDNAIFNAGGDISIGGSWKADPGSNFIHNNNTVTFTATTTGKTITTNSSPFYNLIFNGSGGDWSFADPAIIDNDLTITAGTLSSTQNINVNGGDIICGVTCGTINLTGGTVTLSGAGNFGSPDLASDWTFYNLTFSGTTTAQGTGTIKVLNVLTITPSGSLDAGSKTWNLSGGVATPFDLQGNFIANNSTFIYSGNYPDGNVNIAATTYYHLTIYHPPSTETYQLTGNTSLNGDLYIQAGTLDVTANNYDLNVSGSWTNTSSFNAREGTVTFNGTEAGKTINPGSYPFYNLTFNGSGGEWTLMNNLDIDGNLNLTTGTLVASSFNINLAGNLTIGANGVFTKGGGTFTFDTGTSSYWADDSSNKQDLGRVVVEGGVRSKLVVLNSSVKATKITITANDTLNLGSALHGNTLTLTGSGIGTNKPLIIEGTLTITPGSTVEYTGDSLTEITLVNYYNLTLNGTGPFSTRTSSELSIDYNLNVISGTFHLDGPTTVGNDVFIDSSGILDTFPQINQPPASPLTVGGSWICQGTFYARDGTVTFNSSSDEAIKTNNQPFCGLIFNGPRGSWTMQDALDVNCSFSLQAGTFNQSANDNIYFGGNVHFLSGTVFNKATGNGKVIFDGTDTNETGFWDDTSPQQNLGNVEVGVSTNSNVLVLCSDIKMDSLTINNQGTLYTLRSYDLDVTNFITVKNNGTLDADTQLSARPAGCEIIGFSTEIHLGTHWTVEPNGVFLASNSTVIFDEGTDSNLSSGGTDGYHAFNNLTIQKSAPASVTLVSYDLNVKGNLDIANINSTFDLSTYNLKVGGNWSNKGTFIPNTQTVTFDASSTGKTIETYGTGPGKNFYNIVFNNQNGGWQIINYDLTANNFSLENAASFDASNRIITVNGIFTNLVGGNATNWAGSTLNLIKTGGGSYSINDRSNNGDDYDKLTIGADTHVRMWYSSFNQLEINPSGSLYSMDHQNRDGELYIFGDYHTTNNSTDYWSYKTDFDGTDISSSPRQVKVYLKKTLTTNPSVTVDNGGILNVKGGGASSNDITIVGQDATEAWNFACYGICHVQESTWNYLDLTGGTLTVINSILNNESVSDGTLNVDWYLGDLVVDRASLASIDTDDNDITISEASGASTVWKWSGSGWGDPNSFQTTGTGADGKIPQPGTDGAIRIREYSRTSIGYTFYKYNLHINWQDSTYGEYDYYQGYGHKYISSTLNNSQDVDPCISESWQRDDIDVQNTPTQAIDEPPENGTWYNGMISGLIFTVEGLASNDCPITGGIKINTNATSISFSTVNPENFYNGCQSLVVSTSASNGYIVTIQEIDQMSSGSNQIPDGNCDGGCNETTSDFWNNPTNNGFGYCLKDITGHAAEAAQPINWEANKQCGGSLQSFMILPEKDIEDPVEIMKSFSPVSGDVSYIGFRLSVDTAQPPGTYSTTIIYVITPNY